MLSNSSWRRKKASTIFAAVFTTFSAPLTNPTHFNATATNATSHQTQTSSLEAIFAQWASWCLLRALQTLLSLSSAQLSCRLPEAEGANRPLQAIAAAVF